MTRLVVLLCALGALALAAPGLAAAATIQVNDNTDAPDATPNDGICDTATGGCTLRAAITTANEDSGADTITFTTGGQAPAPDTALPPVTDFLSIDGGGNTKVLFAPTATGNLLDLQATNSVVRAITLSGGDTGATVVNLGMSGDQLGAVTISGTPGTGIRIGATSTRLDGVHVTSAGGTGIRVDGGSATIASPVVTGSGGRGIDVHAPSASITSVNIAGNDSDGIAITGNSSTVSGGGVHGNRGDGVLLNGQVDTVSRVVFYGNGGRPIGDVPGANGGIAPPQNLRIGPRRSDGSLPLTGSASNGTLELWSGNPFSSSAPGLLDVFRVGGAFTYNFAREPQPGAVYAASVTGDNMGTSEFATVAVPQDISSPVASSSRALDTSNVVVEFSEPLNPGSVNAGEFHLNMAGLDRQITSASVAPSGRSVILSSSGWKAGEAGVVDVPGAAAITDSAGNAMTSAPRLRVAAAPGDFIAPLGGSLKVTPKTMCLTHARTCRKPGMTITFTSTEPGKATLLVKRSDVTIGKRLYANIVAGKNKLKFNGRLGARKLRAGRYRLLMYVQDQVGNVTDQPPIVLFRVRRVSK